MQAGQNLRRVAFQKVDTVGYAELRKICPRGDGARRVPLDRRNARLGAGERKSDARQSLARADFQNAFRAELFRRIQHTFQRFVRAGGVAPLFFLRAQRRKFFMFHSVSCKKRQALPAVLNLLFSFRHGKFFPHC